MRCVPERAAVGEPLRLDSDHSPLRPLPGSLTRTTVVSATLAAAQPISGARMWITQDRRATSDIAREPTSYVPASAGAVTLKSALPSSPPSPTHSRGLLPPAILGPVPAVAPVALPFHTCGGDRARLAEHELHQSAATVTCVHHFRGTSARFVRLSHAHRNAGIRSCGSSGRVPRDSRLAKGVQAWCGEAASRWRR